MNSYLLFDPTISDVSTLLEGLDQNCFPIPIHRQTLFETINNIVSENETFELNILAHGAPGGIYVDGEFIGESQWVSGISQLSSSAIQNLDINSRTINFWSCETGAGDSGSHFAEVVSITTATSVNMSSNKVGHASQGANWDLDMRVLPRAPFEEWAMESWKHSLSHYTEAFALKNVTVASVSGSASSGYQSYVDQTTNIGPLYIHTNVTDNSHATGSVSYTHLTLPTMFEV